ncbi:DNA-directed RNA polymerase subunit H [Elysia marginata]|uniref:DNA-directed RNA polymerase subunit H n=1 Tax=Elysia marginata TaxID=1093978 RepID=A0AAV4GRM8_9GAST|nr:DNA-directed RNA polymerase subunit H [Elysia marginata]
MDEHPSFLVFKHLERFLECRSLTPPVGIDFNTPRSRFITELEHIGYYRLDAVTRPGDPASAAYREKTVTIFVLALRGKYTEHAPHLRGLIASLNSENFSREKRLLEVIVVAPEETMKKKNMTDVVKSFRAAAAAGGPTPGSLDGPTPAAEYYNMYPYHVFSLDIPRAQIVPRHTIVSPEKVQAFLARERLSRHDLPLIASSNPPVVWIGGRPNQVICIEHASETAGKAYVYCVVVFRA